MDPGKGKWDSFRDETSQIVRKLEQEGLAEMIALRREGDENRATFEVLASIGALEKERALVIVSGTPEETGVWSYTLLKMGRREESSMRPYYEMAQRIGWGVVALNPHANGVERDRLEYRIQLGAVLSRLYRGSQATRIAFLCFSAGGGIVLEYLNEHRDTAESVCGVILVDTTPPPVVRRQLTDEVRQLLSRTVLYGSEDKQERLSMWARATASVLGLQPIPVRASWHGEMPNLVVEKVGRHLASLEFQALGADGRT